MRSVEGTAEHLERFQGLLPDSQGQDLALTILHVPHSLASGLGAPAGSQKTEAYICIYVDIHVYIFIYTSILRVERDLVRRKPFLFQKVAINMLQYY